jgi:hypothetical protein
MKKPRSGNKEELKTKTTETGSSSLNGGNSGS